MTNYFVRIILKTNCLYFPPETNPEIWKFIFTSYENKQCKRQPNMNTYIKTLETMIIF